MTTHTAIKLLYSVYIKNIQIGNSAPELPLLAHSGMKCTQRTQRTRHTHSLTNSHILVPTCAHISCILVFIYCLAKSGPSISKTSRPLAAINLLCLYPRATHIFPQCMCAAATATRRMGALLLWINKASQKLRAKNSSKSPHTCIWRGICVCKRVLCPSVYYWFVCLKRNICCMSYWPTLRPWANIRVMAQPILDVHRWSRHPHLVEQRCGGLSHLRN